jgi:hypothetical protein
MAGHQKIAEGTDIKSSGQEISHSRNAMKTLLVVLLVFFAWVGSSFADLQIEFKPKVDEAVMKEFDELALEVIIDRGMGDSEEAQRTNVRAKARVFEVGEQADMVFASLIVRNLSHTENQFPPSEWKSTHATPALVTVLRHSPAVAPHLAPALREWLQYLAEGRSGYYHPSMVEESAIYLLHWGGDAERPFLERIATALTKRAEVEERATGLGDEIRKVLKGNGRYYFVPDMPYYQYCGKYVERAQAGKDWLNTSASSAAEPEKQESGPNSVKVSDKKGDAPVVAIASPIHNKYAWLVGVGAVIVVVASLLFFMRRTDRLR